MTKKTEINKHNECFQCKHMGRVPGNFHIKCNKPDPNMQGNAHGIDNGWFIYPMLFDPVWKAVDCANFEQKD